MRVNISFFTKQKRTLRLFIVLINIFCALNITYAQSGEKYSIRTVVIDAGHGGKDPGACSGKNYEKNITLGVALKLGEYISTYIKDVKVIYTRDKDEFIELHRRAGIANENKADLFISIHVNSNVSDKPYGTETYVMGLHKSAENLEVAKRENEVILKEENYSQEYGGFDPNSPEANVIFKLYQNAFLMQSLEFSSLIEKQFGEMAQRKDRGVRQAGFLVLWKTTMPSVLIEVGFLSNPSEAEFMLSGKGQDILASAIFRAFREYKCAMEGVKPEDIMKIPEKEVEIEKEQTKDKDHEKEVEKEGVSVKQPYETSHLNVVKIDSIVGKQPDPMLDSIPLFRPQTISTQPDTSVFFKVQITSSIYSVPLLPDNFAGLKNVEELKGDNGFKYVVGNEKDYNEAVKLQKEMKAFYPDAFLIAVQNGKKIPMDKVKKQ